VGEPTDRLAREGVRAVLKCVDPSQAPRELAGRWYDAELLAELPESVDPYGEKGKFHSFVEDGRASPYHPFDVVVGETVERDGFVFTEVLRVQTDLRWPGCHATCFDPMRAKRTDITRAPSSGGTPP
jgi:hypothetical protein